MIALMVPSENSLGNPLPPGHQGWGRPRASAAGGILLLTPPVSAIGGIATHSDVLQASMPEVRIFDQWWPFRERSGSKSLRTAGHVGALARLEARIRLNRPQSVHLQVSERGIRRDVMHARIARRSGVPVVAHLHGEFGDPASLSALMDLVAVADAFIVLDDATRDMVVKSAEVGSAPRVAVIPNPVHPRFVEAPARAAPEGQGTVRLFCPALIGELKNQRGILSAVDECALRGIDVRASFAGRWDPALSRAERMAIETHARAEIVGVLRGDDLIREYDRADALVLFSRTEGEPMAVLEAMCRRLPVIASDVGAVRLLVPDVVPNAIVDPGDTSRLADVVADLAARSTEERRCMTNRERVLTLRSPEAHVQAIREVHERVRT